MRGDKVGAKKGRPSHAPQEHVARVYDAPSSVLESFLEEEAFDMDLKKRMGFFRPVRNGLK